MAAISNVGIKMAGSHAGVSIGEDGPSQMALEDLAMCRAQPNITVLYPCDARERRAARGARRRIIPGPVYIRTSRPKTPVIYSADETLPVGGLKVLRESADDVATVVGGGVTVFEALKAYDELKAAGTSIRVIDLYSVSPVDRAGARRGGGRRPAATSSPSRITTRRAGLATRWPRPSPTPASRVHRLAVREIPRSGKPDELLDRFGISARHIVEAVRARAEGEDLSARLPD